MNQHRLLYCSIELVGDKVEYVTLSQGMVTLSGATKQRKRAASNLHFKRENKMNLICSHNYLCAEARMSAECLKNENEHQSKKPKHVIPS